MAVTHLRHKIKRGPSKSLPNLFQIRNSEGDIWTFEQIDKSLLSPIDTIKIGIFWRNNAIVFFSDIAVHLFGEQNHSLRLLSAAVTISCSSFHPRPNFAKMVTGGPTLPVQPQLEFGLVTKKMVNVIFFGEWFLCRPYLVNGANRKPLIIKSSSTHITYMYLCIR